MQNQQTCSLTEDNLSQAQSWLISLCRLCKACSTCALSRASMLKS